MVYMELNYPGSSLKITLSLKFQSDPTLNLSLAAICDLVNLLPNCQQKLLVFIRRGVTLGKYGEDFSNSGSVLKYLFI